MDEKPLSRGSVPYFLKRYESNLRRWADVVAKFAHEVDYIVAISRKGPKILKLLIKYGFFEPETAKKIISITVSEFAISRLHADKNTKFLLVDDSIIYGSTFLRIKEFIWECHRSTNVIGAPFAISKTSRPQAQACAEYYGLISRERELEKYICHLTSAFQTLSEPLLVTSPTISIEHLECDSKKVFEQYMMEFARRIGQNSYSLCNNKATLVDERGKEVVKDFYSGFVSVPEKILESYPQATAGFKFYFENDENKKAKIKIVPCCQLSFSLLADDDGSIPWVNFINNFDKNIQHGVGGILLEDLAKQKLSSDVLNLKNYTIESLLKNACCRENSETKSGEIQYYSNIPPTVIQHLAVFHNYLAAFQLFGYYRDDLRESFHSITPELHYEIEADHLRLLLGNQEIEKNVEALNKYLNLAPKPEVPLPLGSLGNDKKCPTELSPVIPKEFVYKHVENLFYQRRVLAEWFERKKQNNSLSGKELLRKMVYYALDYYLWRQHNDIEIPTREQSGNSNMRLVFGHDFFALREIIKKQACIDESDSDAFNNYFRECLELNCDLSSVVPSYFVHEKNYVPKINKLLSSSDVSRRYNAVLQVAVYFRVGEGIPQAIKLYFATKVISDILRVCRLKGEEPKGENIQHVWEKSSNSWQRNELYEYCDDVTDIPTCYAENREHQERIILLEDDSINRIKSIVVAEKEMSCGQ